MHMTPEQQALAEQAMEVVPKAIAAFHGRYPTLRSGSAGFTARTGSLSSTTSARTSAAPFSGSVHVFRTSGFSTLFSSYRLAWYSLGSNIDLSLLQTRLTTYLADIAAAIP